MKHRGDQGLSPPVVSCLAEKKTLNPYIALKVLCIPMGTPVAQQLAPWASLLI